MKSNYVAHSVTSFFFLYIASVNNVSWHTWIKRDAVAAIDELMSAVVESGIKGRAK